MSLPYRGINQNPSEMEAVTKRYKFTQGSEIKVCLISADNMYYKIFNNLRVQCRTYELPETCL